MSTQTTVTLTGERDDLLATLQPVERFVSKQKSNPAICGIRLVQKDSETWAEATDFKMALRRHLWGNFGGDYEVIVEPRIVKAIQSCQDGEVKISFEGGQAIIQGKGKSKYAVAVLSGEWPQHKIGTHVEWDEVPTLDASEVFDAMEVAARFSSRDESRPTINGINVTSDGDLVRIAATDSYRMFTTRVNPNEFWQNAEDITVPHGMVTELTRLFPDGEIKLTSDNNLFYVKDPAGGTYFSCRRIGGKFPPVQGLIPKDEDFKWDVKVPRDELQQALKRIRFMAEGSKKPLSIAIEDDEMVLTAKTDTGQAEEFIDLPDEHAKIKVGVNLDQLTSVASVYTGDTLRFRLISELRPVLVTAEGEEPVTLIMPIRVTSK